MKLIHLLCGCLILIVNIDIFSQHTLGSQSGSLILKWGAGAKSGKGAGKLFGNGTKMLHFERSLSQKSGNGEGGTNALPRTDATGVILSITVVKLYASLEANLIYVKDKLVSNI